MEHCFWIILSLMTGLTSPSTASFHLYIKQGDKFTEYRVNRIADQTWMVRYPIQPGDTISVQYSLNSDKTQFKCTYINEPILLTSYFSGGKPKWDKVRKFSFKGKFSKSGEDDIEVIRSGKNIFLKQSQGSFAYYPVIYSQW